MKKTVKIIAALLVLSAILVLASCSGGVGPDDAEKQISNLLGALMDADYDAASEFMHPDAKSTPERLESFADGLASSGIVITDGVEVKSITGFHQSFYNSEYDGSGYELSFTAKVGEVSCNITALVVKNGNGFGVYSINMSKA